MPPTSYEELLAFVEAHLDAPVARDRAPDGSLYLVGGDPPQVIVRVTSSAVTVSEYAVRVEGPDAPVVRPIRIGSVVWRRIPDTSGMKAISTLIAAARQSRLATFRICVSCETATPPEWMRDDDTCQTCGETRQG